MDHLTITQAAKHLGLSRQQVHNLAAAGKLGTRQDGHWIFTTAELDAYVPGPKTGRPRVVQNLQSTDLRLDGATCLQDAIDAYCASIRQRYTGTSRTVDTAATYQVALGRFLQWVQFRTGKPDPVVSDLLATDQADMIPWMAERWKDATIKLTITAVTTFLSHLDRQQVLSFRLSSAEQYYQEHKPVFPQQVKDITIDTDKILDLHLQMKPAKRMRLPRQNQADRRLFMDQIQDLVWHRDHALLEFLFGSGVRISEAIQLRRDDVRDGRNDLVIVRGKGGKARFVAVTPAARAAIRSYLALRQDDQPWLFLSHHGRDVQDHITRFGAYKLVAKLAQEAGLGTLGPHDIRKWLATMALRNGVDIKTVSASLGHKDTGVTERVYAHVDQQRVAERMGELAQRVRKQET